MADGSCPAVAPEQTDAEARLRSGLRSHQRGARFRRQHRAEGYILDFACMDAMLAIELDGGRHARQRDENAVRSAVLGKAGWRVRRFWNHDV